MNIHDHARHLSAQRQIPLAAAYAELSRRAAVRRRVNRPPSVLDITPADRAAAGAVESQRYWWMERD